MTIKGYLGTVALLKPGEFVPGTRYTIPAGIIEGIKQYEVIEGVFIELHTFSPGKMEVRTLVFRHDDGKEIRIPVDKKIDEYGAIAIVHLHETLSLHEQH